MRRSFPLFDFLIFYSFLKLLKLQGTTGLMHAKRITSNMMLTTITGETYPGSLPVGLSAVPT